MKRWALTAVLCLAVVVSAHAAGTQPAAAILSASGKPAEPAPVFMTHSSIIPNGQAATTVLTDNGAAQIQTIATGHIAANGQRESAQTFGRGYWSSWFGQPSHYGNNGYGYTDGYYGNGYGNNLVGAGSWWGRRKLQQWGFSGAQAQAQAQAQSQSMGGMSQSQAQAQAQAGSGGFGGSQAQAQAQAQSQSSGGGYGGYGGYNRGYGGYRRWGGYWGGK